MPTGTWPHLLLEACAYTVGANVYWRAARRMRIAQPELGDRLALIAGAILGAFLGSKLLHIAEHFPTLVARDDAQLWLAGKSLVGGLLGGTLGVELVKRRVGWTSPTGDPWVPALAVGIIIGRIGCQLSGTWDLTYGSPTTLPWGWDYGDGVTRHPTAAYEILLVAILWLLVARARLLAPAGARFAAFVMGYCAIRFVLEFLKPPFGDATAALPATLYAGLTAIQCASLAGMVYFAASLRKRLKPG